MKTFYNLPKSSESFEMNIGMEQMEWKVLDKRNGIPATER